MDNENADAFIGSVLGGRRGTNQSICETHTVKLEFVVKTRRFDMDKMGNEGAQKGEVVYKCLTPYFPVGSQVPDIVYNISTILSRFTSGQYALQMRNSRRDLKTIDGQTIMTGLVPTFNMSTYQKDSITPCRFDFMWQYAILGLKMALTHQHIKSQDIANKNGLVVSPDMQHMLSLYQALGADISLCRTNKGTGIDGESWKYMDKFITPQDVVTIRGIYDEFISIVEKKAKV